MSRVYAYLRVSTDDQDVVNQRFGVLTYCNSQKLSHVAFVKDSVSGKKSWKERKLGKLLRVTKKGDTIIFSEISRIGRSTLQVLEVLQEAARQGVSVHVAKQKMVMDGSMQAQITAVVLGLAAEIEREFISARTTEGLARRKSEIAKNGFFINKRGEKVCKLGRPKRSQKRVKLDDHADEIRSLLQKGVSKSSISKIVNCAPSTLYAWLKRNQKE